MPRFRVRTLMILVGIVAVILGLIGPGRKAFRRWSHDREQIARFARFENKERVREAAEVKLADDQAAILAALMATPKCVNMSTDDQEKAIAATIIYHGELSNQARSAAEQWAEHRRTSEQAIWSSLDPFAPELP